MREDIDILLLAHTDWYGLGNPARAMATALARNGWHIFFSRGVYYSWEVFDEHWSSSPFFTRIDEVHGVRVHVPGKFPFRWPRFERFESWVMKHECSKLFPRSSEPAKRRITLVLHPKFGSFLPYLACDDVIYWAVDLLRAQPDYDDASEQAHRHMMAQADMLLAASRSVGALAFDEHFEPDHVLRSGVDVELVIAAADAPPPADLEDIPHPRIGYIGAINQKVDLRIVAHVARARPDWHWVIIGPLNIGPPLPNVDDVTNAWLECERLDNVHWLGPRPFADVPRYLNNMDVNTICYRLDIGNWTKTAYPFKVHECLAAGKPVVSSRLPELLIHDDVIEFAETPEEWLAAVARALDAPADDREARLAVAKQNTWDKRVKELTTPISRGPIAVAHPRRTPR